MKLREKTTRDPDPEQINEYIQECQKTAHRPDSVNGIHISKLREVADLLGLPKVTIYIAPSLGGKYLARAYSGWGSAHCIEILDTIFPASYGDKTEDGVKCAWLCFLHEVYHCLAHVMPSKRDLNADQIDQISYTEAKLSSGDISDEEKEFFESLLELRDQHEKEANEYAEFQYEKLKSEEVIP